MSFTALAGSLEARQAAIMERWLQAVRQGEFSSAQGLSEPRLRDHVPDLLARICEAVAGGATPTVESEAQEHGRQRFGTGYDIAEVVRELIYSRKKRSSWKAQPECSARSARRTVVREPGAPWAIGSGLRPRPRARCLWQPPRSVWRCSG